MMAADIAEGACEEGCEMIRVRIQFTRKSRSQSECSCSRAKDFPYVKYLFINIGLKIDGCHVDKSFCR